jgi:hypothetical protein
MASKQWRTFNKPLFLGAFMQFELNSQTVKQAVYRLSKFFSDNKKDVPHAMLFEVVSKVFNFKDWNTCKAILDNPAYDDAAYINGHELVIETTASSQHLLNTIASVSLDADFKAPARLTFSNKNVHRIEFDFKKYSSNNSLTMLMKLIKQLKEESFDIKLFYIVRTRKEKEDLIGFLQLSKRSKPKQESNLKGTLNRDLREISDFIRNHERLNDIQKDDLTREALASVAQGHVISSDEVEQWIESWDKEDENENPLIKRLFPKRKGHLSFLNEERSPEFSDQISNMETKVTSEVHFPFSTEDMVQLAKQDPDFIYQGKRGDASVSIEGKNVTQHKLKNSDKKETVSVDLRSSRYSQEQVDYIKSIMRANSDVLGGGEIRDHQSFVHRGNLDQFKKDVQEGRDSGIPIPHEEVIKRRKAKWSKLKK